MDSGGYVVILHLALVAMLYSIYLVISTTDIKIQEMIYFVDGVTTTGVLSVRKWA